MASLKLLISKCLGPLQWMNRASSFRCDVRERYSAPTGTVSNGSPHLRIQTLSDELAKNDREIIEVEKKYHVFIMGPSNKTVESIKQQTGTRIRIPPLSSKEDITIVITGEKEGVAEAKKAVAAIYNDCKANIKDTSMQVRTSCVSEV